MDRTYTKPPGSGREIGGIDMAWTDFVPGLDIIAHLTKTPKGSSPSDYAGFATTATECNTNAAAGILRCNQAIAAQALQWVIDWVGFPLTADAVKVVIGIIASALNPALLVVGGVIAGLGILDAAVVVKKAFDISAAAAAAKTTYCVCGWQAPPPPSPPSDG